MAVGGSMNETARGMKKEWKRQQEAAARAALPLEVPRPGAELCPGDCLAFPLPSGKYGAAVVVARHSTPGGDQVVVVVSRLAADRPPRLQQVVTADVLIINYDGLLYPAREIYVLQAASYSMSNVPFMRIGHLQIARAFKPSEYVQAGTGWDGIPDT